MALNGQHSAEDGFFTCEVSVKHKTDTAQPVVPPPHGPGPAKNPLTAKPPSRPVSAGSRPITPTTTPARLGRSPPTSCGALPLGHGQFCLVAGSTVAATKHDDEQHLAADASGRKVVWPANQTKYVKEEVETAKTFHNTYKQAQERADQPYRWIQKAGGEDSQGGFTNRVSRSRSRSKNIAERARSFERGGNNGCAVDYLDSRGNSRPVSRSGSMASRHRSPSGGGGGGGARLGTATESDSWVHHVDRPASRTDVDSRRFGEIGRVNTLDWEERIHNGASTENIALLAAKTPPPKRREMNIMKSQQEDRGVVTRTPEPPPPPTRFIQQQQQQQLPAREETPPFPPPPPSTSDSRSKLSEESVNMLSEENKESIVKQWVESTSQSTKDIEKELEKFAYDIAENVVNSMEKKEMEEKYSTLSSTSTTEQMSSSGVFHAVPATTNHALHGPVYVQDQNRRVGMTFQQEERRRQEMRKAEEAKQEERRRRDQLAQEEEAKRIELQRMEAEKMRVEEEARRMEERRRQEEEQRKREEETKRRRMEEEKRRRMEEEKRQREEEERRRIVEEEERVRKEELKRQELLRYEKLKEEEERKRLEEMRLEQEMRKQVELQQKRAHEEEREKQEQQKQKNASVRTHIPKLHKSNSFKANQERTESMRFDEHLGKVSTGQVHEKRNFWIRSTSMDRLGQPTTSPAPRRRRLDGWNSRQKENEDPDSRPGSALGHGHNTTGSTRSLASGFLSKSKSSAAVVQDGEEERSRPRQRATVAAWTKEEQQQANQNGLKFQEVKTNKVNETVTTWGKQDQMATAGSGRSTPVPSNHIGQVFAENRMARGTIDQERSANNWRTKTPEPSLKLVNVSVEKAVGSNQNIHISENAHVQMANFMQESSRSSQQHRQETSSYATGAASTSSSSQISSSTVEMMTCCSSGYSSQQQQQPPPTPERNQSFGGKSTDIVSDHTTKAPPTTPTPPTTTTTATTTSSRAKSSTTHSVQSERTETQKTDKANIDPCVESVEPNKEPQQPPPLLPTRVSNGGAVSKQDQNQPAQPPNRLQSSPSAQSINSVLSNCSSGALPLPVRQGWYDELELMSTSSSTTCLSSVGGQAGIMSPTGTGTTPLPVVAKWFTHSDIGNKNTIKKSPIKSAEVSAAIVAAAAGKSLTVDHRHSLLSDDLDIRSVNSDATVIENKNTVEQPQPGSADPVVNVFTEELIPPESPKEIRKKFQKAASFDKQYQKSADVELSQEFREGIRGKVKLSKETFMKQLSADKIAEVKGQRETELKEIRLQRSGSMKFDEEGSPEDKLEKLREEKLMELEAVKHARSKSLARDEEVIGRGEEVAAAATTVCSSSSSYLQEKHEREHELANLARRPVRPLLDKSAANQHFQLTEAEILAREVKLERERELAELVNRPGPMAMPIEELSDVHQQATTEENSPARTESVRALKENFSNPREQRREDTSRGRSRTVELEGDEVRSRVQGVANIWQQRDQSAGRADRPATPLVYTADSAEQWRELASSSPTRRIGGLFRRDPEYWGGEEGSSGAANSGSSSSSNHNQHHHPPPPPRQSSRGKVEEYSSSSSSSIQINNSGSSWTAPWRDGGDGSAQYHLH